MKKRFISVLVVCVMVMLTACKGGASSGKEQKSAGDSDGTQAESGLVWAGWSGEEAANKPILEEMIHSWNENNPDNPVNWVGWPWADTLQQLIIRNSGNEKLDVAQIDSSMFPALVAADALEDVTAIIDPEWLSENIPESALAFGQSADGIQYGIPWTTASIGMVYNPSILKEAGYEEPPATMKEFEQCMAKIKESNPDIIPYALSTMDSTATSDFMPWLWTYGGSIFNENGELSIDSDASVQTLQWYKDMADKGYIKAAMSRFDARQLFAQGKIAFYDDAIMAQGIAESNGVASDKLDMSIQPMLRPVLEEGDIPASCMWGHMLVIFKKSDNKEKAAEFIRYIISEEVSLDYFEATGMLPVEKSALENPIITDNVWANKWSEITVSGQNDELQIYEQNAELSTVISEEIQAVVVGEKLPEEAAESMQKRMGAIL